MVSLTDSREQKGERNQLEHTESFSPRPAGRKVSEKSQSPQAWNRAGKWDGRGMCESRDFLSKGAQRRIFHNHTEKQSGCFKTMLCRSSVLATIFCSSLCEHQSLSVQKIFLEHLRYVGDYSKYNQGEDARIYWISTTGTVLGTMVHISSFSLGKNPQRSLRSCFPNEETEAQKDNTTLPKVTQSVEEAHLTRKSILFQLHLAAAM